MSEFTDEQIPAIARRVLAERAAGREISKERAAWAEGVLRAEREKLSADPRFAGWAAGQPA